MAKAEGSPTAILIGCLVAIILLLLLIIALMLWRLHWRRLLGKVGGAPGQGGHGSWAGSGELLSKAGRAHSAFPPRRVPGLAHGAITRRWGLPGCRATITGTQEEGVWKGTWKACVF